MMKQIFSARMKDMREALAQVIHAGDFKKTPVLHKVYFRQHGAGTIGATCSNMDAAVTVEFNGTWLAEATIAVEAKPLLALLKLQNPGATVEVAMTSEPPECFVTIGAERYSLPCIPGDEFPQITPMDMAEASSVSLNATDFLAQLESCAFAASTELTRYYLNGVFFCAAPDKTFRMVATDGHRLVVADSQTGAMNREAIVPTHAVKLLQKLLKKQGGGISVSVSDTKALFVTGGFRLLTKLVDGVYPSYARVIPQHCLSAPAALFDLDNLALAVKKAQAGSADKAPRVIIDLAGTPESGNETTVGMSDGGTFAIKGTILENSLGGRIAFNSGYLADLAAHCPGRLARMQFGGVNGSDATAPTLIVAGAWTMVLMPMRR